MGFLGDVFSKGSPQSSQSQVFSQEQVDLARQLAARSQEHVGLTESIRGRTADIFRNFLDTGRTPGFLDLPSQVSPLAALSLPALGNQQNLIQNQLMQQGARGGLLQQQLGNLAIQGGLQRTGLMQQDLLRQEQRDVLRNEMKHRLFGGASEYGTGGLSLGLSGLGQAVAGISGAASNLNQLGAQRITQNQIAQQGIGQILGKGVGALAGGPLGSAVGGKLAGSALGGGAAGAGGYGGAMGLSRGSVGGMFG